MRYPHVIAAFAAEPWAMQREKLEAIARLLAFQAAGGKYEPEEIKARISDRQAHEVARSDGGVFVLPLVGIMSQRLNAMDNISGGGGVSTDAMGDAFSAAVADDQIKAVVIDVDSGGGSTYGVEDLASRVRAARGIKPIIAQVNSVAASAAYWVATQADEIVVTPGGLAGSIGVYAVHEDISDALAKEGIKPTIIKAGDNKAELTGYSPLSDEAKAAVQDRVDQEYGKFVKGVAAGRNTTVATVKDGMGQGRVFGVDDLLKRGMADRISPLRDTMARFGASMPRTSGAANSRQAFAQGRNPTLSQIEDVLRDAGFPNALATAFVSAGKGALRSESGPNETPSISPAEKAALASLMAKLSA
jgi:signal peptide peptidase SppA